MNRNIFILSMCQALGMSSAPMIVLVGGIIGSDLAPSASLSTLPLAIMVIGGALFSLPAALLMGKVGRRYGFMAGSALALAASLLAIQAIITRNFYLFCLATLGIGGNMAFIQQYRFAAAESVHQNHIGRAISMVLVGGILAAFIGPELAKNSRDWLPFGPYSGSFASLTVIYVINIILLSFLSVTIKENAVLTGTKRPFSQMAFQPLFMTAVLAGLVAYSVMTFIMTATPISMHIIDGFSL
ncbi:MAG: MFS transporter, partial [Proteobacteria bacterium]|nr:MFS transporter [Pseudomonadota bacterium]